MFCCDVLDYFYECRNCVDNNMGKLKAIFSQLTPLFDVMPKHLVLRAAVSPQASKLPTSSH